MFARRVLQNVGASFIQSWNLCKHISSISFPHSVLRNLWSRQQFFPSHNKNRITRGHAPIQNWRSRGKTHNLNFYFVAVVFNCLKRRLSSGKRWKVICERYHCYYASVEEHQIKNVPWKASLFKCFHILNKACNNIKIRTDFYATCLCIHLSVYSACNFTKTGPNFFLILMIPEPCSTPILIC